MEASEYKFWGFFCVLKYINKLKCYIHFLFLTFYGIFLYVLYICFKFLYIYYNIYIIYFTCIVYIYIFLFFLLRNKIKHTKRTRVYKKVYKYRYIDEKEVEGEIIRKEGFFKKANIFIKIILIILSEILIFVWLIGRFIYFLRCAFLIKELEKVMAENGFKKTV